MEQHKHLNFQSMTLKKIVGGLIVICCIGLGLVGCGSSIPKKAELERLQECSDAYKDFLEAMKKEDYSSAVNYYDSGYRKLKSFYPTTHFAKVKKEELLKIYEDSESKELLYNYAKEKTSNQD